MHDFICHMFRHKTHLVFCLANNIYKWKVLLIMIGHIECVFVGFVRPAGAIVPDEGERISGIILIGNYSRAKSKLVRL